MFGRLGIRTRIAGGSLLIAILVSIIAGIVINSQVERIVRDGTIAVLSSDSAPYVVALQREPKDPLDSPGPSQFVAVVAPGGSVRVDTLPLRLSSLLAEATGKYRTQDIVVSSGRHYIVQTTIVEVDGLRWSVVAARAAQEENVVLDQMRWLLIAGMASIAVGVGVTAWILAGASLRPVKRLRVSASRLSAASTDEFLPVARSGDEISELARTLNALIERLRASVARERQLVSDASHELRTPLAILRTQLEMARTEGSSAEQLVEDIRGAQRSAARLSGLVTSLLELSTVESSPDSGETSANLLDREAAEAVGRASFRAAGTDIEVSYEGLEGEASQGLQFAIRDEDFGRMIDNLANNALAAMSTSGTLRVRLEVVEDELRLSVADTGGGLEPDFQDRAFERFTRFGDSGSPARGAGLGLAIVAAIVKNAGGAIELENEVGVGLGVMVTLPANRHQKRGDHS